VACSGGWGEVVAVGCGVYRLGCLTVWVDCGVDSVRLFATQHQQNLHRLESRAFIRLSEASLTEFAESRTF
jgi:hypothetical protein